ncbi:MAG: hypothetical protein D6805_02870 [Planctomycetota bacterium]|nr:MAG: hypothetical protein D6805_02870 [Planctomycetota bacterium]
MKNLIEIPCAFCQRSFPIPAALLTKEVQCPFCNQHFQAQTNTRRILLEDLENAFRKHLTQNPKKSKKNTPPKPTPPE